MFAQEKSITRRLTKIIMVTSSIVLVLTCATFFTVELITFQRRMAQAFETRSKIIAATSTATLAFDDPEGATEILSALQVDPRMMGAALYDTNGTLFARSPTNQPASFFPPAPGAIGTRFARNHLIVFHPVVQEGKRLGTLYMRTNLGTINERLKVYGGVVILILAGSLAVAYFLSRGLQRQISQPILALVNTARTVADSKDYSVRAPKLAEDELGTLTDVFNDMLAQIYEREAALRENTARLGLALEASRTGTWDYHIPTGRIVWDAYLYRLFGLRVGEFHGTYEHYLSLIHPDDRATVMHVVRTAMDERIEFIAEFRVVWPDGTIHHMSSRGRAFYDEHGKPIRMTGVTLDVTASREAEEARRRSEELLRAVVDTAVDGIITTDERGTVLTMNAAAEQIFGYGVAEIAGQNVKMLMPSPYQAEQDSYLQSYLVTGRRATIGVGREVEGRRKDGTSFPLDLAVSETRLKDGRIFTGIVRDITERKRAEEEIRRLNMELEERVRRRTAELAETNQELEAFTYSVSHDLRAPLRHIDGYAQVLQDDFAESLPEQAREYLQRIRRGTQNMGHLVDDLLHFARLGRQELMRKETALRPLVMDVLSDLKLELQSRRVEFVVSDLPVVPCDPGLIKQVFANLLSNAVKYTRPREEGVIEVGQQEKSGAIFVRDNGVGFNMKYADKLFGVFQRLHRVEEFEGTGVGLATVERIVRKHGGRIWAEAELDKGATFYFTLGNEFQETEPNGKG